MKRGCKIVTFNPVREKGLVTFKNPQNPLEMLTGKETQISTLYLPVKAGGDIAAIMGMLKHVLAAEEKKRAEEKHHVIDVDFLEQHTIGWAEVKAKIEAASWEEIEHESALSHRSGGSRRRLHRRASHHLHVRHGSDPARPRV